MSKIIKQTAVFELSIYAEGSKEMRKIRSNCNPRYASINSYGGPFTRKRDRESELYDILTSYFSSEKEKSQAVEEAWVISTRRYELKKPYAQN